MCTRADYCTVQRLGIDDFEEVERLIERGQREGLLKLRTSEEIAGILELPLNTVRTHLFRARELLRRRLYEPEH